MKIYRATNKDEDVLFGKKMESGLAVKHERLLLMALACTAGSVIVVICRVTAVCANSLPLTDVSVFTAIMLLSRTTPLKGVGCKSSRTGDLPGDVLGLGVTFQR